MDKIDLSKPVINYLTGIAAQNFKTSLMGISKSEARKSKRKTSYERVKNFTLDKSIAEPILDHLHEKPTFSLDDQNNYQFSRAVFYKSLAGLMKMSGIKSHRSNFFGRISGPPDDINSFYNMISPDYVNGPITNQSLHVYMSDLSRKRYHELVQFIHSTDSTPTDSIEHGTHVLRTLLAAVDPHIENTFTIMDQEYTSLHSLPLPLLSYLTKQPLSSDVVIGELDQSVTDSIDSVLCERFVAKFEKILENCHLIYTLDAETAESLQIEDTTLKVEYDPHQRLLRLRTDEPVIIAGFRLNSSDSFKKIATTKDKEFTIPDGITHVFISCKNGGHCICGKIHGSKQEDEEKTSVPATTAEHTDEMAHSDFTAEPAVAD